MSTTQAIRTDNETEHVADVEMSVATPSTAPAIGPKLALKIARVMAELQSIPKDGYNEHSKYAYATESAIVDHLRPLMAKHQLAIVPTQIDEPDVTVGKTRGGADNYLTTVRVRFTLVDAESGESTVISIVGSGMDMGEKGLYKAYTGAKKYALLMTFMISTGEDDAERETHEIQDARPAKQKESKQKGDKPPTQREQMKQSADEAKEKPSTQNQHKNIYTLASKAGMSNDDVKSTFLNPVYKVDSAKKLTFGQATELVQFLRLYPIAERMLDADSVDDVEQAAQDYKSLQLLARPQKWIERKHEQALAKFDDTSDETPGDVEPQDIPDESENEQPFSDEELREMDEKGL